MRGKALERDCLNAHTFTLPLTFAHQRRNAGVVALTNSYTLCIYTFQYRLIIMCSGKWKDAQLKSRVVDDNMLFFLLLSALIIDLKTVCFSLKKEYSFNDSMVGSFTFMYVLYLMYFILKYVLHIHHTVILAHRFRARKLRNWGARGMKTL